MTYVFRSLKEHNLSLSFQLDDIGMNIKFVNGCYETDDDNIGQYLLTKKEYGKDYLENSEWKKVPDKQVKGKVVLESPVDLDPERAKKHIPKKKPTKRKTKK